MSTFRVLVTDPIITRADDGTPSRYISPPQSEQQARSLVALLLRRRAVEGHGPWRQAVPDGQLTVELEREQ
jgi:hypothetical protein